MKKKKGGVFIGLGLVLIAASAVWGAYNLYDGYRAGVAANESVAFLEQVILPENTLALPESAPAAGAGGVDLSGENVATDGFFVYSTENDAGQNELPVPEDPIAVDVPKEVEIPDYILNPDMKMPVVRHDGQDYIGILEIPAIDLKIPVISEWNYPRLRIAPCRYAGSAYTGNLVISAHNYATHFGGLKKLYEGAAVIFTDADGNRFNYRVGGIETLGPRAVEEMVDSGWDLSLFTCTPGGSYRVTVRCELVSLASY